MVERVRIRARKPKRVKLFVPEFNDTLKKWTAAFCYKNAWKVAGLMDYDDLYQECCVKFTVCKNKYRNLDGPAHFASLYRTACGNMLINFAAKRNEMFEAKLQRAEPTPERDPLDAVWVDEHFGYLQRLVDTVPELKELVSAFNDQAKMQEMRKGKRVSRARCGVRLRETRNQFLCRVLGLDPDQFNVAQAIDDYLRT